MLKPQPPSRSSLLALLVLALAVPAGAQTAEYVIHISVDGLDGPELANLIAADPVEYDGFKRLVDEGASTFNARTDYSHTITLPNHASMITGRPVSQPAGQANTVHHGYTSNGEPGPAETLHNSGNPNVSYFDSTLGVVHDNGFSTALYVSKTKFSLFDQSYDASNGAPDVTGPDDGADKIDTYVQAHTGSPENASNMHAQFLLGMAANKYSYTFVHYLDPDSAGHASGWGSAAWDESIKDVDNYVADILDLIEGDATLDGNTVVIVTTDHGGSGTGHGDASDAGVYTIPFFVWGADIPGGNDLYALNASTRTNPGSGRPNYDAVGQPIRNGDSGNLALALLGLPAVPGSTINSAQDLTVHPSAWTEDFESGTTGQTIGTHPDWFDEGAGPVITAGAGTASSVGLAPGTDIFIWTAHPFDWNAAGFESVTLSMDFETSPSGELDDDRIGWTFTDDDVDSSNIFGIQIDPSSPGPGLEIQGYWDGPITPDLRPLITALPALGNDTWYRLQATFTKLTATSVRIDASLTELDANGDPVGPPVASGTIADTSLLGPDVPDTKYFAAPSIWPAYKNFTAADGAADNAYAFPLGGSVPGGGGPAQPGDLIIAGFQAWNQVTGQDPAEFIELFNTTDQPISLQGLEIVSRTDSDANGSLDVDWTLSSESPDLSSAVIQPYSFFLIAESGVAAPGGLHDLEVDMDLATGEGGSAERAIGLELLLGGVALDRVVYGRHDGSDTGASPPGDLDPFAFPRAEVIRNTLGTGSFEEGVVRRLSANDLFSGPDVTGYYTDEGALGDGNPIGVWTSPHDNVDGSYQARNSQSPPVTPLGVSEVDYLSDGVEIVSDGPAGTPWNYYDQIGFPSTAYPPDDGQGDAWNEPGYDDSGWANDQGPFGYGDLDGLPLNTVFDNGQGGGACSSGTPCNITYLLRTTFALTEIPTTLVAEIQRDDGFILYLNGAEVARDNLTNPVDASTFSDTTIGGADETVFTRFVLDPNDLVVGTNTLAVEVHNRDETSSDVGFDMRLLAGATVWSYYDQIPSGSATYPVDGQSDAWNQDDFDDSAWPTGAGLFGYGDLNGLAPETLLDNGQGGGACSGATPCRITYLFRTTFEVSEIPTSLTAQVIRDDGFVLYLNGVEVSRDNLIGPVDASTVASATIGGADESTFFTFTLDPLALVVGTNTLAVEVHNRDATSSDVGFQLELTGIEIGEPPPVLTLGEDFEDELPGNDPAGWYDSGANNSMVEVPSLFEVVDLAGNKVFSTSSPLVNIHSHLLSSGFEASSGYQLFGRMRIDSNTGIGVTYMSDYPNSDRYYRLRRVPGENFELAPHGPSEGGLSGTLDSGVVPAVNTWYRFRILVQDTGNQTILRAKIWVDGASEPGAWQIDVIDAQVDRLTGGTFGVWAMEPGTKYWDSFFVTSSLLDPGCGNGALDQGEQCDDGNLVDGDCCSMTCSFETAGTSCDADGDLCTLETCDGAGVCNSGAPLDCTDSNLCTSDTCDPHIGCQNIHNTAPCEDGNLCTSGDVCSAGACVPGGPTNCDDANVCTNDSCSPLIGCQHANNTAACEDGNLCTTGDVCATGVCVGGGAPDCNDANVCTLDSCDPGLGCVNEVDPQTCAPEVPSTPPWGPWLIALMLLAAAVIHVRSPRTSR